MRVGRVIGGAVGLLGAAAAAGIAQQRRTVVRSRALIDPKAAAALGALTGDRQSVVHTDDGVGLHAEQDGPADAALTVVFVHGFTLNLGSFDFQRRALAEHFGSRIRLVCYDQRSHGRSERSPAQGCTIEQTGRDLDSVLDQLVPTGPIVLVGHSMGGMSLMALASQRPELLVAGGRVRAVVLINTSSGELRTITLGLPSALARLHGPVLPLVLRRAAKNAALVERGRALGKDLAWAVTKRLSFADQSVDPAVVDFCTQMIAGTPVDVVADFYPTLMEHDGRLGLQNLRECPVLVIGADSDALTPSEHSERIADSVPHAQLIMVPNSGHLLMLEHPAAVNEPLLAVVESALTKTEKSA
ncbi:MAG: alpha/beta hydrolase [Actinomycetota bacterium]|nr:alpha/beta hydrolase [Actinomycetota bacterium]MDQ2957395.1 alpha/beta hydrolase [Actinomycetota bacterium]